MSSLQRQKGLAGPGLRKREEDKEGRKTRQAAASRRRQPSETSRIHMLCRARRLRERFHQRCDGWNDPQQTERLQSRKALRNDVIEQAAQRRPVAVDINE